MSQYRCELCDIPLTVEQLRVEVGVCPPCRADLDAGYQAKRRYLIARLLFLLRFVHYRRCTIMMLELIDLAPKAPWVSK